METIDVPKALRDRLGEPATAGLVELLDDAKREWTADVIAVVGERFERRLVAETSGLRVEMAQGFASVRVEMAEGLASVRREMAEGLASVRLEMAEGLASVRQEMAEGLASVRQEMAEGLASVRQEMAEGLASVRQEMAQQRVELLKWAFVFWMGQFVAMVSLFALGIRLLRPGS